MSVTSVSLGNFYTTSDGKNVLGGAGGSGLDTQSIIKSLVAAKSAPITQDQTAITTNTSQITALGQMQTYLSAFKTAADALRNPPGVNNEANNVFAFTTGTVSPNGANYVSIDTSPGASLQTYQIDNITQLASAASQSTGTITVHDTNTSVVADPLTPTAGKFTAGTITLPGNQQLTIATGDSLNNIASKFNAVSSTTGISATVIQVGDGTYQMLFNSTTTGASTSFDLSSTSVDPGNTVFGNVSLGTAVAGKDAKFKLNGIAIDRPTNSISDVITGVNFNLLQTTSADDTTESGITATVAPDKTTVQNTIISFVTAYNALKTFEASQTQLNSDGTYATTSVLANNQTFRSTLSSVEQQVNSQVNGLASGAIKSLAAIGITFTTQPATSTTPAVDNILTVNDGQLTAALTSNYTQVSNLFGFNTVSNSPNLKIFDATKPLGVSSITITANPGTNTFTADVGDGSPITLTATQIAGSGYALAGPAGSKLDGLTLIYGNTSGNSETMTMSITQGIAAQAYNTSNTALTATTGTIALAIKSIQTNTDSLNDDITKQTTLVNQYQTQLTNQFAALEQAVSSINTLLQSLAANSQAATNAAGG